MKVLPVVRAGYGMVELAAPGLLAERLLGQRLDPPARLIARILGARHLAQACLSGPAPTAAVLALHTASMIGVAVLSRQWRPAALISAAAATGFATAGGLATRNARRHPPGRVRHGQAVQLRDRWAEQLARYLIPPIRAVR